MRGCWAGVCVDGRGPGLGTAHVTGFGASAPS